MMLATYTQMKPLFARSSHSSARDRRINKWQRFKQNINFNFNYKIGPKFAYRTITVLLVHGRNTESQSHQEHNGNVSLILVLNWMIQWIRINISTHLKYSVWVSSCIDFLFFWIRDRKLLHVLNYVALHDLGKWGQRMSVGYSKCLCEPTERIRLHIHIKWPHSQLPNSLYSCHETKIRLIGFASGKG